MNLSPLPIQKFFGNNGRPLVNGRLFTYEAGTSDPIDTYTDSSGGTPNTNPIVLDFRGECRLWIDPQQAYKFILAPAGNDDPPTNPIWTVDNITAAPQALDNAAVDHGSVNNISLNIPQISSPVAFTRVVFKAANINTGPTTLQINGGTAHDLTWQNVADFSGGEIQAAGIYEAIFDGARWQLQGPTLQPPQMRSPAEIAAGVIPVNYAYSPGHLLRYGTNTVPGTTNMAPAFAAAISLKMPIHVPYGLYRHDGPMAPITEGGLIGEGWGSGGAAQKAQILFYNITNPTQPAVQLAYSADNAGGLRFFENIDIRASSWDPVTGANGDGMDITGSSRVRNVQIASFKRYGLFLHNTTVDGQAPYDSLLENVKVAFSGQHGIVHGTGANTVTYINCGARWSGAPSYGTAPTVAGNYDGFYLDYQGAANPGGAFFSYVPEGITIIGGDCSYNSRYGWNFNACQGAILQPGYAEVNLQAPPGEVNLGSGLSNCFIALNAISAVTAGVNFGMALAPIGPDGVAVGRTNRVFMGGRDCGIGNSNTETNRYQFANSRLRTMLGNNDDFSNSTFMNAQSTGDVDLGATGTGKWNLAVPLYRSGIQVLNTRRTGWTAATGTANRTTFDTASVTTAQLAERVKALIDDLMAHGLIGP